ncbi:MAG TPA: hypothetical protein EYP21_09505 [Syntrophaceae bacterium]|nr:hypothetical protein [Syntrophaceae bacterium]
MEFISNELANYITTAPLLAILLAFVGGVLTSFTPCTYPLIPITAGFIGARATSKLKGFSLSLFYVLGLAIVYSILGGIAALTGQLFGQVTTNPWGHFIVANLCLFFGLAMLDVFIIQPPQIFYRLQPRKIKGYNAISALFAGGISSLVAAPCTVPVLGILLTFVASHRNVTLGMFMLFFFAFGMGTLLILVGTFAGLLSSLPKSGKWQQRVKRFLALLMIGAAQYFLIRAGQLFM